MQRHFLLDDILFCSRDICEIRRNKRKPLFGELKFGEMKDMYLITMNMILVTGNMQTAERDERHVAFLDHKMVHEKVEQRDGEMPSRQTDTGRITDNRQPIHDVESLTQLRRSGVVRRQLTQLLLPQTEVVVVGQATVPPISNELHWYHNCTSIQTSSSIVIMVSGVA